MRYSLEIVFLALVLLTSFTFFLGKMTDINSLILLLILLTTLIKGLSITEVFMGLNAVRNKYRLIPIFWLFFVLFSIGMAFFL
ncbi:hypothetical protein MNB_SV-13-1992 [hydrothermal vent metagenome]|uniref:Cytochrome C oxidase subunit IV n=1 Tax=hydrothermal vent metagenome TaxID=652676 RepID=A0A1W1CXG5_9ZZZZ